MDNFKVLTLKSADEWTGFLQRLPDSQTDVYYTPSYYSLYEEYGDGKVFCFVYEKDGHLILYPFLRNEINKCGYDLDRIYYDIQGAYGYNGIVSSTQDSSIISRFYEKFHEYCVDNCIVAEFTRFHPLIKNYEYINKNQELIFDRNTVYIDLQKSMDDIFAAMQKNTRTEIRTATRRHGLSSQFYSELPFGLADKLIAIYEETMERLDADEYLRFNATYFKDLFDNKNSVTLVCYDDLQEPVCFYTSIYSKDYFNMHLGGSKTAALKKSPNNFMYFETAKQAKALGCKYMLFGGGTTSSPDDSLLRYKKHISPLLADFYIGKTIHNNAIYFDIVEQWQRKYPEQYVANKIKLLGYRDV